jgi:hypothetical protein
MSVAIESAFVNTVVDREDCDSAKLWDNRTGGIRIGPLPSPCAQQDTTVKRTSGLRMWMSRSAARDKSGYVFNSINAARAMVNDE